MVFAGFVGMIFVQIQSENRYMIFVQIQSKNRYKLCPFWSGIRYGFEGTMGVYIICRYLSFLFRMNKKERVTIM